MLKTVKDVLLFLIAINHHGMIALRRGYTGVSVRVDVAKAIFSSVRELYFTIHKPIENEKHILRLWIRKPEASNFMHLGWSGESIVFELSIDDPNDFLIELEKVFDYSFSVFSIQDSSSVPSVDVYALNSLK